ncbi:MAG: CoA pyrophosphatase [Deltaproteobacteria bacterium]|nr:CoA pyrophosphatase [Deltaproteobacteria bacterium]
MKGSHIRSTLAAYKPLKYAINNNCRAAVLVPLKYSEKNKEKYEVILTRRAAELADHGGQVSFPGGRIESTDSSPEHAALRETQEELGIVPQDIEIIGRLDDMITITGFHIVPILGILPNKISYFPDFHEVARVFSVPLYWLMQPQNWKQHTIQYKSQTVHFYSAEWNGENIWGATAQIIQNLIKVLKYWGI